jgi:hypothetical protein
MTIFYCFRFETPPTLQSELLYDRRFTANQFVLALRPALFGLHFSYTKLLDDHVLYPVITNEAQASNVIIRCEVYAIGKNLVCRKSKYNFFRSFEFGLSAGVGSRIGL